MDQKVWNNLNPKINVWHLNLNLMLTKYFLNLDLPSSSYFTYVFKHLPLTSLLQTLKVKKAKLSFPSTIDWHLTPLNGTKMT